jgi:very-long-chain (3R)-3-hydroxyacyl-CoA dehydratase
MQKQYLKVYNLLLFIGWSIFFFYALLHGFVLDNFSLMLLNICQVAALLEILHAVLKWTPSPVFTTTLQIFSRVFVLYWLNVVPVEQEISFIGINGIAVVSVAWGITEMVRYSHYFFSLLGKPLSVLNYLRYTLFIVLYPIGITGEGMILFSVMKMNGWEVSVINGIITIVLISYIPFFPKLYGYMWKQRKKRLS